MSSTKISAEKKKETTPGPIWTGLYGAFENVLAKYMRSKGHRYAQFSKVCKDEQITLVMYTAQPRGEFKDEYYCRTTALILQLCKTFWLHRDGDDFQGGTKTKITVDNAVELKRRLGGFFLLYTMYEKQPFPDGVRIALGDQDIKALAEFLDVKEGLPFRGEVNFIMEYLLSKDAFHYCVFPEEVRYERIIGRFLDSTRTNIIGLTKLLRDTQSVVIYSSFFRQEEESEMGVEEVPLAKDDFLEELLKTAKCECLVKHMKEAGSLGCFVKMIGKDKLRRELEVIQAVLTKAVVALKTLGFEPAPKGLEGKGGSALKTGPQPADQYGDKKAFSSTKESNEDNEAKDDEEQKECAVAL